MASNTAKRKVTAHLHPRLLSELLTLKSNYLLMASFGSSTETFNSNGSKSDPQFLFLNSSLTPACSDLVASRPNLLPKPGPLSQPRHPNPSLLHITAITSSYRFYLLFSNSSPSWLYPHHLSFPDTLADSYLVAFPSGKPLLLLGWPKICFGF